MINYVISGTIGGEYNFPNDLFSGYCYEGWGNAWSMIDGITAKYIPANTLINNPNRFDEIDILMAEFGQTELHSIANQCEVFTIATESGAGFDVDRINSAEGKQDFIDKVDECNLFFSTTHGGAEYLRLFSQTPILDIPLPMDLNRFSPRRMGKFEEFTVCLGEIIESCYDDRPLQLEAAAVARSLGARITATMGPQSRSFAAQDLKRLGFDIELYPHKGLYEMSNDYLAKSHVSIMLGQRSTFGRFVYVSWAVGIPCIATRYHCQERICLELTVGVEQVDVIASLLRRLRDDGDFYRYCRRVGLENVKRHLAKEVIALHIVNEVLPLYFTYSEEKRSRAKNTNAESNG